MKKRIEWIDIARGIGILLVVLGHSVTTVIRKDSYIAKYIFDTVYYFQLPLLFMVSGLAFNLSYEKYKSQHIGDYFVSKCKRLMLPYASYSLLVYLIFSLANCIPETSLLLTNMGYGKMSFFRWLRGVVIGNNLYSEHIWYLYSLFVLSLLAFILVKYTGKNYKAILLVITLIMWWFFRGISEYDIIWKTSYRGIWFAFGCLGGIKNNYTKREKVMIIFLGVIVLASKEQIWEYIDQEVVRLAFDMFIIAVILYTIIVVAQVLEELGEKKIKWLGENSLSIYLFHQPFWGSGLGVVLYKIIHLPVSVCILVSVTASIVIPIMVDRILKHPRLKTMRFLLMGE